MNKIEIGDGFESVIEWMTDNGEVVFDGIVTGVEFVLDLLKWILHFPPAWVLILLAGLLAWRVSGKGLAIFSLAGFFLIQNLGFWEPTMDTLALVITAVLIALIIGVPLGIGSAKNETLNRVVRPVLDFMQTLPAFVYLIPAVLFFQLGEVPGVIATLIFALPPCVRFTGLGIRQVPADIHDAAISFGSSPRQLLFKAELPVALPTMMAGVNQTIMLALSMVVICGMIGAGGLGNEVLKGITQMKIDLGFEAGICIVILAIFLDRITQELGKSGRSEPHA
ncbi:proline/glycine betaine ABC transporter permease [Kiritimatiellaeota bacterium B1221]|nr:proline/glycine betaine ABC transporter permease [Kiritimatiellaeota bacterium B1221]